MDGTRQANEQQSECSFEAKWGAMMSLKSEIKVGSQFEFSIHGENGIRQKAVVTQFLSNREEGLGPEADFYIADWMWSARQFLYQ